MSRLRRQVILSRHGQVSVERDMQFYEPSKAKTCFQIGGSHIRVFGVLAW